MFAVVIGLCGSAYAMGIGGIQRTVQVWIHGDQTDATLVVENGSYSLDYEDKDGNLVHRGGGVAINPDGTERPLTEEELWDEINAPEVEYEEDGRVVVYYLNQQLDVTDKFVDGVCYVQLQVEDSVFTRLSSIKMAMPGALTATSNRTCSTSGYNARLETGRAFC